MGDRPLKGTTDWVRSEVVLDVPETTLGLAFGALLVGLGELWLADLQLEIVGEDVPTTNLIRDQPGAPDRPVNLEFSE
ncbi:MAG: hypothetical protein ACI9EF_001846 [Pseudohongiellaceae bacterium]|jgi:hypothetical protein